MNNLLTREYRSLCHAEALKPKLRSRAMPLEAEVACFGDIFLHFSDMRQGNRISCDVGMSFRPGASAFKISVAFAGTKGAINRDHPDQILRLRSVKPQNPANTQKL